MCIECDCVLMVLALHVWSLSERGPVLWYNLTVPYKLDY